MAQVAHEIWEHPELGYLETRASKLLQDELAAAGFEVQAGIAGMPTAFVASAGNGKGPVIALLAEMDALPGMSPAALPAHAPVDGPDAGKIGRPSCRERVCQYGSSSVGAVS